MRQELDFAPDMDLKAVSDSIPESADHTPSFAHSLRTLLRLLREDTRAWDQSQRR